MSSRNLLVFRGLAAAFHWLILIKRLSEDERLPAFCYLTNIVYLLCTLYYTTAVYNGLFIGEDKILFHHTSSNAHVFRMDKLCYEQKTASGNLNVMRRLQWLLHSIVLTMGILVSIMYFLLIYNPEEDILSLTNISRHILNSVFLLVEFTFNTLAVKFYHLVHCLVLSVCYAIYTFIFWYVVEPPENYIYRIINWGKPFRTCSLIALLMFAALILNIVLVGISKLKLRLIFPTRNPSTPSFLV